MKAMILAAGLGTRLKPFTDLHPKALFPINEIPLLQIQIQKLIHYGINNITINVYHFKEQIIDFIEKNNNFNIQIQISDETELLDTGGGIFFAKKYLGTDEDVLIVNVDILSDINYFDLYTFHSLHSNDITLAVSQRNTSRYLLFDSNFLLQGWKDVLQNKVKPEKTDITRLQEFAFSGIQIISPILLKKHSPTGIFSIIDFYLDICNKSKIMGYLHSSKNWYDVGKTADLKNFTGQVF